MRCFLLEGMRANRIESRPNCNEKGGIVEIISRKNSILSSLIFLSFLSLSLFSRERERVTRYPFTQNGYKIRSNPYGFFPNSENDPGTDLLGHYLKKREGREKSVVDSVSVG